MSPEKEPAHLPSSRQARRKKGRSKTERIVAKKSCGPALYRLSDTGNVERLVADNVNSLRFCREIGWLAYDGTRWVTGAEHRAFEAARRLAQKLPKLELLEQEEAHVAEISPVSVDSLSHRCPTS